MQVKSNKKENFINEIRFKIDNVYNAKSVFLSSGESVEILEVLAATHFLENGADKVSVELSVPICSVSVGDSVRISTPSYGVPLPESKDLFVVTAVSFEFSERSAVTKISAVRWDF